MNRALAAVAISVLLASCGSPKDPNAPVLSREPISVRGWIADVDNGTHNSYRTIETESVRRAQLFQSATLWVDGAPYVSGGIAETGAFIVLDVPPGDVTITFSAPGAPASKLVLKGVPGNADVIVPAILLKHDGVELLQPEAVKIRMAARITAAHPSGKSAVVAGRTVPVIDTPLVEMKDRLDYPRAPLSNVPLATVK